MIDRGTLLCTIIKGEETSSRNGKEVFVSRNPLERHAHYDSSA